VAIIGDEDTVTGFLLAGIGHRDQKNASNFLVVDPESQSQRSAPRPRVQCR
jgi:V-type H+-transporting ATPase subunit F